MDPDSQQAAADALFAKALAEAGARDPRGYYRGQLRQLKRINPERYAEAVAFYRETLIPSIAEGASEPLAAWREYGWRIARASAKGKTVAVDESGRAQAYKHPGKDGDLVLHLPDLRKETPIVVGLPNELSAAQRALYDWLVAGRRALRGT